MKNIGKNEIEFEFGRAMKNTLRFQEKASIGTLCAQKAIFGSKEPKKEKVTVKWE